ncbi:hypothetical protein ACH5RR_022917, partial [Cinchona calisaya]
MDERVGNEGGWRKGGCKGEVNTHTSTLINSINADVTSSRVEQSPSLGRIFTVDFDEATPTQFDTRASSAFKQKETFTDALHHGAAVQRLGTAAQNLDIEAAAPLVNSTNATAASKPILDIVDVAAAHELDVDVATPLEVDLAATCENTVAAPIRQVARVMSSCNELFKNNNGVVATAVDNDQACLTTTQDNALSTCSSRRTSSANNPNQFATVQSCGGIVKIKNASVIDKFTAGPRPSIEAHKVSALVVNENSTLSIDGIHNPTTHDTSKNTSNLVIQDNFIATPLDSGVDGVTVIPPKYILVLPSTTNTKRKVEKQASRTLMMARGKVNKQATKTTLDDYSIDIDDDLINPNLSYDAPINETIDIPTNSDTCDDNDDDDIINCEL